MKNSKTEEKPFIIGIAGKNGEYDVKVYGRDYKFGRGLFLDSIVSMGEELLAAPIRVVGTENGRDIVWDDARCFPMDLNPEGTVRVSRSAQSSRFLANTSVTIEDDGCMDWYLTLAPQGRSVNQVFGLEKTDNDRRELTRLWVEIPLKKSVARFYHVNQGMNVVLDGKNTNDAGMLAQAGAFPAREIALPFKQQVYLGNDEVGFGVFFESDEGWQPADGSRAIECVADGDEVVLRLRILDSEPISWHDKGRSNGMDMLPITFRIGMIATPVKPFPANPYTERNLHIDCFKKIPQDYEEYLFGPAGEGGGSVFDRIQRAGVNTLYIHEKWNDIQNSPELTVTAADRLKTIVAEAHRRGIKVVPYFGYEISTLSPIFGKYGAEYFGLDGERAHWYRKPWQRDITVCYNSGWRDYFVEHIEELFDRYDIDGIYLDSLANIAPCRNRRHGCGYVGADGSIKPTFPVWAIRDLMKRIHAIAKRHGGFVSTHSYASFSLPILAFSDVLWEGETVQAQMLKGTMDTVPVDYLRAVYSGRNLGVPVNMLCYSNPPLWTFRQATANALPLGVIPKPNDAGGPLDEMRGIWDALDAFPIAEAKWRPYYDNDIRTDNVNVIVSGYETDAEELLFVANMHDSPTGKVTVTLPCDAVVCDAIGGGEVPTRDGRFVVEFDKFDYRILRAKKGVKR